jgi:hypothetical protein
VQSSHLLRRLINARRLWYKATVDPFAAVTFFKGRERKMYLSYEHYTRGQRRSIDGTERTDAAEDLSMRRADQRQLLLVVIIFLSLLIFPAPPLLLGLR